MSSPAVAVACRAILVGGYAAGLVFAAVSLSSPRGVKDRPRAGGHETALSVGKEFVAGSTATFRCRVYSVRSLTETAPHPGAGVRVSFVARHRRLTEVYRGRAGEDGTLLGSFRVPDLPAGEYTLVVRTVSDSGEDVVRRAVKVSSPARVLLTTDKPLYQPGQVIRLRALALNAFDLTPAAGKKLTLEVEDAKANKVYKRELTTSEYGIAFADFRLADEVNQGEYRLRATLGEHRAEKTVTVKPYVLPKFKVALKADRTFYLPRQTVRGDLQVDYFFGKPVARAKVKVTASTFDVAFKEFQTWEGDTDDRGQASFRIKLPDSFVGLPLAKGDALVRLEVKVTDSADHTETVSKTYPVSAQPIKVSLLPEGGRLVPGMENRVFAVTSYPDGTPARCAVRVWAGRKAAGKPLAVVKTNPAGLAEFPLVPRAEWLHSRGPGRLAERVAGLREETARPSAVMDLTARADDGEGRTAHTVAALTGEPGENVLLRLDRAIYREGDALDVDVRCSADLPTVYLDVVKSGQTVLTRALEVRKGRARGTVELGPHLAGTLEVHAYQVLPSGEIVRDARVVYVHPANDLKVKVTADRKEYLPGEEGVIRFEVTDSAGKPAQSALGVLVVDEAVYALQEVRPGLEKVFFTLQQELLRPRAQVVYEPKGGMEKLIREPVLAEDRQQAARVLLTSVRPAAPKQWVIEPMAERRGRYEPQVRALGWAVLVHATRHGLPAVLEEGDSPRRAFRRDLLPYLVKKYRLDPETLRHPFGGKLTIGELTRLEKGFTVENLALAVTQVRMRGLFRHFLTYTEKRDARWYGLDGWRFPKGVMADLALKARLTDAGREDAWGNRIRLVAHPRRPNATGYSQLDRHDLVSAGPDGRFGTADDIKLSVLLAAPSPSPWWRAGAGSGRGAFAPGLVWVGAYNPFTGQPLNPLAEEGGGLAGLGGFGGGLAGLGGGLAGLGGGIGGLPGATGAPTPPRPASAPPPPRLREYFPETLLWRPALITDERGRAELRVPLADSITTWRLSASASSRAGALGGATAPLRVFQDFFCDLDLPVALTQDDEVAFPVAVYNYLKGAQTVTLDLKPEPWFELADGRGYRRTLDLKAGQVTSVKFRIRAKKVGNFPLTVNARGTRMSDAVKRSIDVLPDGVKVEQVFTDRLKGAVTHTVTIPGGAIEGASRLVVKVYPGVMSQVLEGTEGMLRLPGG